jgi:hypothetical protein
MPNEGTTKDENELSPTPPPPPRGSVSLPAGRQGWGGTALFECEQFFSVLIYVFWYNVYSLQLKNLFHRSIIAATSQGKKF